MKEERSRFYNEGELLCLQGLIHKYDLHQISKFIGKPREKKNAWSRLSKEFNSVKANSQRTESQFRKCWANLKSKARRNAARVPDKTENSTEQESQRANNHHCSCSRVAVVTPFFTEREQQCLQGLIRKYGLHLNSTFMHYESIRRRAWGRVSKDYNSIKSNSRRTEAQLINWWKNLKTRKKILARLKSEGSQTERESTKPSENSYAVIEDTEDPLELLEPTYEVKREVDFNSIPAETPTDELEVLPPEMVQEQMALVLNIKNEPPHSSTPSSSFDENGHVDTEDLQWLNSKRIEEREEELHRLRVAEKEWQVKAAEEVYLKARLERQSAEELLRFGMAKREEAEKKMNKD